ncbi:MAG: ATP-binding protein, partial [Myxococcota bacterium]
NRAKDGSIYWVATTIVPFLDDEGRPKQYVAIRFEITERKLAETALERTVRDLAVAREEEARRAEALSEAHDRLQAAHRRIKEEQAKLIQAEKLSSIGILASGVAHEINNPLAGVMNCVKALSEDTVRQTRRGEYFRTAQDGLERIQQIVRGLLDYARQRPLTPTTCDVEEILAACQRLIAPYLRKNNVELDLRLPATQVKGDRSQLMQALINILLNAVYVSEPNQAVIVSVQKAPGQIGITVRDFGPGMPEDVAQRACDPFFTTKPEGEGTGLGLAVTASIVRAHGGELEFQVHGRNDDAEAGTSATIWLPEVGTQGAHHA